MLFVLLARQPPVTPISPLPLSPTPPSSLSSLSLPSSSSRPPNYFEREERIRCDAFDENLNYGDAITFLNAEQTPEGIYRMFEYYESVFNLCKKPRPIRGRHNVPSQNPIEMKTFPKNLNEWKVHFKYMGSVNSRDNICYYKYAAGAIRYYYDLFNMPISWKYVHFLAYRIVIDTIPKPTQQTDDPMKIETPDECVMCLQETIWTTPCGHWLCRTCENSVSVCPVCGRQLKPIYLYNSYMYRRIEEFCKGLLNKCTCMYVR